MSMGQTTWYRVKTSHLDLYSEVKNESLAPLGAQFEERYRLLEQLMFGQDVREISRTRVVVFRDEKSYRHALQDWLSAGHFVPKLLGELEFRPTIILYADDETSMSVFTHEMTHRFISHSLTGVPIWLHEGMASYYESMVVDGDFVQLGHFPGDSRLGTQSDVRAGKTKEGRWLFSFPVAGIVRPSKLFELDREAFMREREAGDSRLQQALAIRNNYLSAWALVHFFHNGPEDMREAFVRTLNAAASGTPFEQALQSELRGFAKGDLDARFLAHVRAKELRLWTREIALEPYKTPSATELSWPERLVLQAALFHPATSEFKRSVEKLAELSEDDQDTLGSNVFLGNIMLFLRQFDDASHFFARCEQYNEKSPHCLAGHLSVYLAQQGKDVDNNGELELTLDEKAQQWAEKLETYGQSAVHLLLLARVHMATSQPAKAKELAMRGFQESSYCVDCLEVVAAATYELGHAREALNLQTMAINLLPENVGELVYSRYKAKLRLYSEVVQHTQTPPHASKGASIHLPQSSVPHGSM